MNNGNAEQAPAYPLALHPYGLVGMPVGAGAGVGGVGGGVGGVGANGPIGTIGGDLALGDISQQLGIPSNILTNIDLSGTAWCQFPTTNGYELRSQVDDVTYDEVASLNYHTITAAPVQKFEHIKCEDCPTKAYDEAHLFLKQDPETSQDGKSLASTITPTSGFDEKDKTPTGVAGEGTTPAKRGRPTENPCWSYFIRLDDQNVRCRLCNKVVKSACATNMTKHLERHHQNDYQQLIIQIKQYRQQKGPFPMNTFGAFETLTATPLQATAVPNGDGQNFCVLPTGNYVKSEPYPEVYSPQYDREDAARGVFAQYERQDPSLWHRTAWTATPAQWPNEAVNIDITNGVLPNGHLVTTQQPQPIQQLWTTTALPGTSTGPEKPYMKRNRKTEHPVWEYFKRTTDGNAQCGICTGIVKSPCSSNFMRHLMRHHTTEYNNVYVKWVQKRGCSK